MGQPFCETADTDIECPANEVMLPVLEVSRAEPHPALLQSQHVEDSLMYAAQWQAAAETLYRFNAEGELAKSRECM